MSASLETVHVHLDERSYSIVIDNNWIPGLGEQLKGGLSFERVLVVTNPQISKLYGAEVINSLSSAGYSAEILEIPEGEKHKNLSTPQMIYDFLMEYNYSRQSSIAALGGGVVGDIAGFAAATYMRGINFVQIPTSLVAMVDSSIGGKVGVNHPLGKNIIGAFYQPKCVFIDVATLNTLAKVEFRAGFAEVIKHGVIMDEDFFTYLEDNLTSIFALEPECLKHIITVSCKIKARVVEQDETEKGLRAILNFGHTIGHALEALTHYTHFKHGESVALGMIAASRIAQKMDMIGEDVLQRITALIEKAGLPTTMPTIDTIDLIDRLKKDKKVRNSKVRFVLPQKIGAVLVRDDVPKHFIIEAINEMSPQ